MCQKMIDFVMAYLQDDPEHLAGIIIALLLFFILAGVAACHKRLEKVQLAVQELCDRIWKRWKKE